MSDIRFNCPDCEGHLVVDSAGAGRQMSCPHCGKHLVIPEPVHPPPLATPTQVVVPPAPAGGDHGGLSIKKATGEGEMGFEDDKPHGSDVNVTEPITKKKDQWFTENGRRYHFCYYDPHSPVMETACGAKKKLPVNRAKIVSGSLDDLKKGALCVKCLAALDS